MARILEGTIKANETWKAMIRCVGMGVNRITGCFALMEIEPMDICVETDWELNNTYSMSCPACGMKIYLSLQIDKQQLASACKLKKEDV